jgi:hypothetical protein
MTINKLSPQATREYQRHNDGSIAKAICHCKFCKYVRHIRQPWYPCPFKACPSCRPDLDFKVKVVEAPRALLSNAKGKAPNNWKFNRLQGLTDEERECLK